MKTIYELSGFCSSQRHLIEALLSKKQEDLIWKLYRILYSGQVLNNSEAMLEVCGKVDMKLFSALKAKMFETLIKVISIQNVSIISDNIRYNRVVESMRQNLASRIILYRGGRSLAMDLLERSMLNSPNDQLSFNVLDQLRVLTLHYGTSNFNKYKLNKYLDLEKHYYELVKCEAKAIHYYIDLKKLEMHSLADISAKDKMRAAKYAEELGQIEFTSRTFNFYRFQVFVKKYEFEREFYALLSLCDRAEEEFSSSELYSLSSVVVIRQVRLWTLIQLGRFLECISRGLPELVDDELGATNWYSFLHYTLKAYLYNANYVQAARLISYCLNHRNYRRLNSELKEVANLHLGYLHLIIASRIDNESLIAKEEIPNFRLGKFLNTNQIFSKDKRGINVSILLMHIAFLLQRKDYNAIIDRTDSLNQYAYRYLRKDDSFRSNCMIKMVIQMTKADFNPIRTARYTADLRKQLGHVTLAGSGENIEVEIIPFEVLWEIMTKAL